MWFSLSPIGVLLLVLSLPALLCLASGGSHHFDKWHPEEGEDEHEWSPEDRHRNHNLKSDRKPNIILFFCDDLGFGDLPIYGSPTVYAPFIQRMTKNGLFFTNFYSASPVCSPSRAAVLTGRYQMRSGFYPKGIHPSDIGGLPKNETTMAEMFKDAGYNTGMIGKWHLGVGENKTHLPINHGFDYYFGIPYTHDACPCTTCFYPNEPCRKECHSADEFVGCPLMENDKIVQQPTDLTTLTENCNNAAVQFIYRASDTEDPFFLYYAIHHTHWPQYAGKAARNSSIAGILGDSIREIDNSVGALFQALVESGEYYNTLFFFTADNGPDLEQGMYGGSAGPFRCGKTQTWEGGFRVPAVAWWPGKIKQGRTTKFATILDLFPTFANIAGGKIPDDRRMDGYDMAPILYYKQDSKREHFAYFPEDSDPEIGPHAIRWSHYKAHFYTQGGNAADDYPDVACRRSLNLTRHDPPILYDLWMDPGEMNPLVPYENYDLLLKMLEVREEYMNDITWGVPQPLIGRDYKLQPCARPDCEPWPYCCQTDLLSNNDYKFNMDKIKKQH